MTALSILVLVGCGRVGFDAVRDGGEVDALDALQGCAAQPELCNGIDDNCDGRVDEGCTCTPFDITIPTAQLAPAPGFVWTGAGYVVTLQVGTLIGLQPIGADGTLGTFVPLFATTVGQLSIGSTSLAWSGTEVGIAWSASSSAELSTYAPAGDQLSGPMLVNDAGIVTKTFVTWNGTRFAVGWLDGAQIGVREVGADLTLFDEVEVPTNVITLSSIAFSAPNYVLGTQDATLFPFAVLFTMASAATPVIQPLGVGNGGSFCDVIPGPGGFAGAWTQGPASSGVQLLDPDGTPRGSAITLPEDMGSPFFVLGITAEPDRFRIDGETGSNAHTIMFTSFDATGAVVDPLTVYGAYNTSQGFGIVSAAGAAGRHAIAVPYTETAGDNVVRVIQNCD